MIYLGLFFNLVALCCGLMAIYHALRAAARIFDEDSPEYYARLRATGEWMVLGTIASLVADLCDPSRAARRW